ncbi:hypothetical protein [Cohnella sp. GCM10012308]|uniref:hypothetical protein n=1 Tax=Cohnella sp. GCM10012308 TaxID=3317329 RepID=UPI00361570D6
MAIGPLLPSAANAGCSAPAKYEGRSDNWKVSTTYDSSADIKSYEIRYIGKEEALDGTVGYAFKDSRNFQERGESAILRKNMKITGRFTVVAPMEEEDGFVLEMRWNGNQETIPIERKK